MAHMFVKTHGDRTNVFSVVAYLAVLQIRGLAAMMPRASGRPPATASRAHTITGAPGREQAPRKAMSLVSGRVCCCVTELVCDADVAAWM